MPFIRHHLMSVLQRGSGREKPVLEARASIRTESGFEKQRDHGPLPPPAEDQLFKAPEALAVWVAMASIKGGDNAS
jgi:hypothetical protein